MQLALRAAPPGSRSTAAAEPQASEALTEALLVAQTPTRPLRIVEPAPTPEVILASGTAEPADAPRSVRGAHRLPTPTPALRGRILIAAAAVGAFAAAGHSLGNAGATTAPKVALASSTTGTGIGTAVGGAVPALPRVLAVVKAADPGAVQQLAKGERMGVERAAREAAARRPLYVVPAVGTFTSGFGARWGTVHYGDDIANAIGTPIVSVGDGTVIDAGPAEGFGQWVRVRLDDGTVTVYGHVDSFVAHQGDKVKAGQEIATIGNRGQSTGPHLHFEVWLNGTDKVDPKPWLAERGIFVG
ncbi:MAG: M23 family metallopeptidase [Mycobacteriaceae bacterium]